MYDGDNCRCEVSMQSYSPSNVELRLRNANFWEFLGDFSVRERSTNFRGCIIKLHPGRVLCETMSGIRSVTSEITF